MRIGRPMQTPLISPKDIPDAARFLLRHPGQAKREPGSHKGRRLYLLRSRIRLRLSGMTAPYGEPCLGGAPRPSAFQEARKSGLHSHGNGHRAGDCWHPRLDRGAARDHRADESPGGDASARPQDHAQAHRRLLRRQGRVPALAPGACNVKGISGPSRAIRSTATRRNGKRFSRRRAASRMCAPFRTSAAPMERLMPIGDDANA